MKKRKKSIQLFLCGDVMSGREIDQALPRSVDPVLYESYVRDARDYLYLAERVNGNIPEPVSYEYIWGDAMDVFNKKSPTLNLSTLKPVLRPIMNPGREKAFTTVCTLKISGYWKLPALIIAALRIIIYLIGAEPA